MIEGKERKGVNSGKERVEKQINEEKKMREKFGEYKVEKRLENDGKEEKVIDRE